jgi:hypothetical protein
MVTPGRRTDHLRVDAPQFCPIGRARVFLHPLSFKPFPGVRTVNRKGLAKRASNPATGA